MKTLKFNGENIKLTDENIASIEKALLQIAERDKLFHDGINKAAKEIMKTNEKVFQLQDKVKELENEIASLKIRLSSYEDESGWLPVF